MTNAEARGAPSSPDEESARDAFTMSIVGTDWGPTGGKAPA